MKRFFRLFSRLSCQQRANGMSATVAIAAVLFLHLESSPIPAGADVARRPSANRPFVIATAKPEQTKAVVQTAEVATDLTPDQLLHKDLVEKIRLIERGIEFLSKMPDYTAQFVKQELVNGDLLDEQEMEMKVRHAPFSIYLKWVTGEQGREILFVDGAHDGYMKAHGGGWKARLPTVSLEPTSSIAMAESRYPVNKAGLLELAKMMLDVHRLDLEQKRIARCEKLADQMFDERPCHAFLIEYKDRKSSEQYRKSISLIDKEWSIPVYTRNFGWLDGQVPADEEQHDTASLIEFYSYSKIQFRTKLVAMDFDHTNEDYRFKR